MPALWIASNNEKKRVELARCLGGRGYDLRLQSEAPVKLDVVEDRPDFAGNAELKARALAGVVADYAVADDSGLCVDALDGRPGVHSARYGGDRCNSDAERAALLLHELDSVPTAQRAARFVCHICLVDPDGEVLARIEESCPGTIITAPRGEGGFGYDPVFVAAAHAHLDPAPTFAQLSPEEKDEVSHRGAALRRLVEFLENHPLAAHP